MVEEIDRSLSQVVEVDPTRLSSSTNAPDEVLQAELLQNIQPGIQLCGVCNRGFTKGKGLREHLAVVHGIGKFHKCADCHTRYRSSKLLLEHRRKTHECDRCNIRFEAKSDAVQHLLTYHEHSYLCPEPGCSKKLISKGGIKSHLAIYHGKGKVFDCPECMRHFRYVSNLEKHMVSHTPEEEQKRFKFACRFCDVMFATRRAFLEHRSNRHGPPRFVCDRCNKEFPTKTLLLSHKVCSHVQYVKPSVQYACDECRETFQSKGLLALHNLCSHCPSHQWLKPIKQYTCDQCDESFDTKIHIVVHKEMVHNSTHQWEGAENLSDDCGAQDLSDGCDTTQNLADGSGTTQQDLSDDDDDIPQEGLLDVCDDDVSDVHETTVGSPHGADKEEGMSQSDSEVQLVSHLKHSCLYCGQRFITLNGKDQHEIRVSQDAGRKECSDCNKVFITSCQLLVHDREVHGKPMIQYLGKSGESVSVQCTEGDEVPATVHTPKDCTTTIHGIGQLLQCPDCIYRFANETALRIHIAIVHKTGRYKCKDCGLIFRSFTKLNEHMKEGHKRLPFSCPVCKMSFALPSTLNFHLAQSHVQKWLETDANDSASEAWFGSKQTELSPTYTSVSARPLPDHASSSVHLASLGTLSSPSHISSLVQTTVACRPRAPLPVHTSSQACYSAVESWFGSNQTQRSPTSTSSVSVRPLPDHTLSSVYSVSSGTLPSPSLISSMEQTSIIAGGPRASFPVHASCQGHYNASEAWFGSKQTEPSPTSTSYASARPLPDYTSTLTLGTLSAPSFNSPMIQTTSVITHGPKASLPVHTSSVVYPTPYVPTPLTPMAFSGYSPSMMHAGAVYGPFVLAPTQLVYPSYNFPMVQVPSSPTAMLPSPTTMLYPYHSSLVCADTLGSRLPFKQSPPVVHKSFVRPQQYCQPPSSTVQAEPLRPMAPSSSVTPLRPMAPPGPISSVAPGECASPNQSLGQAQGAEARFLRREESRGFSSSKSASALPAKSHVNTSWAQVVHSSASPSIDISEKPNDLECSKDRSSNTPQPGSSLKSLNKLVDTIGRKVHLCTRCGIKFNDMTGVYDHMRAAHSGMEFVIVKADQTTSRSTAEIQQGVHSSSSLIDDTGRAIVKAKQHTPKKKYVPVKRVILEEESFDYIGSSQRVAKSPTVEATDQKMRPIDDIAWRLAKDANR